MKLTCEVINPAAQPSLTIRTRTSVQNLPQVLGQGYQEIIEHLVRQGQEPAGPPFVAYYNMDMENLDIELGLTTKSKLEGKGEIKSGVIPAGSYSTCIYTGPYPEMAQAYAQLTSWTQEQGLQPSGVVYEFYLNDPGETPPEDLQTQIWFALVS
jgi:effector-binding domain-containing protein